MKAMTCPQCGAAVDFEEGQGYATCRFCLTKLAVPGASQHKPGEKLPERKPAEPANPPPPLPETHLGPEAKIVIWGLVLLAVLVVIALSASGAA